MYTISKSQSLIKLKTPTIKKTKILQLIIFLFCSSTIVGQTLNTKIIDSLTVQLKEKNQSPLDKAILYNLLAEEYQGLEPEKSFEFLNKALPISIKNKYSKGIADYYRISSKNHFSQAKYERAIVTANQSIQLYLNLKDTLNYLKTLPSLVRATYKNGQLDKAIELTLKGVKFTNNHKFGYELGNLYHELCFFYNIKDDIYNALLNIEKAENAFSFSTQKSNGYLKCYQQRSQIYTKTNQHKKAIQYADKALKIALELKFHKNILSVLYTTLGIAYFNIDDNVNAVKNLEIANEINNKYGAKDRRAFNMVMLSEAYFGIKKYTEAINLAKKAMKSVDDDEISLMALGVIGNSNFEIKEYKAALTSQLKALQLIDLVDDTDHQRSIYSEISKTYYELGDYKNAYFYGAKFNDLELQFLKNIQEKNINEIEIKYESKQKDLELKELTITKQLQNLEILKQKKFNELLFAFIVFALLIIITIIIAYVNNTKKNRLLNLKNNIITEKIAIVENQRIKLSQSLNEKNILLKEIHHRVKNNLQLVMSLLNIQARDKESKSIEDFLEKGQSRIASMILIHENLYQNKNVGNIDFEEYITTLTHHIKDSFGENSEKIAITVTAKEVCLDIETAVPLGLIINELVTNSMKHAFQDAREGKIEVSLFKKDQNNYELTISDTGVGLKKGTSSKQSMGLQLVSLLVLQLKGTITTVEKNGLSYVITFMDSYQNKKHID